MPLPPRRRLLALRRAHPTQGLAQRFPSPPACTYDFYDAYFACHGRFPSSGSWSGETWQPEDCRLPPVGGGCLFERASGVRAPARILLLGDSMAMRTNMALQRAMSQLGVTCNTVASEGGAYYGSAGLEVGRRDCGGCDASTLSCSAANGVAVEFQYLVMEFLIDFELTQKSRIHWDEGSCSFSEDVPCRWAWNTQLSIFDAYLRGRPGGYPDEIHIIQSIHDCARRTAADFARDLRWLMQLIDESAPPSTRVYMWEAAALNPAHQPMNWARVTSDTCVQMMNAAVQRELAAYAAKPPGAPGPVWRPTAGLFERSVAVIDSNYDGVHYHPFWYDNVARTMLAGYCADK